MSGEATAILAAMLPLACLADIVITDVTARQRYPWDGKVDIAYAVSGCVPTGGGLRTRLRVMAVDQATHVTNIATVLSGDVSLDAGTHEIVWDMGVQGLSLQSSNMEFYVLCETDVSLLDYIDWRIASSSVTNAGAVAQANAASADASHISSGTIAAARLPVAGASTVGAVRPDGTTITIDASGTLTSVGGGGGCPGEITNEVNFLKSQWKTGWTFPSDKWEHGYINANGNFVASEGYRCLKIDVAGYDDALSVDALVTYNTEAIPRTYRNGYISTNGVVTFAYTRGLQALDAISFPIPRGTKWVFLSAANNFDKIAATVNFSSSVPKNYPALNEYTRPSTYATTEIPYGNVISDGSSLGYGGANLLFGKNVWIFGDSLVESTEFAPWLEMVSGAKVTLFAKAGTSTCPEWATFLESSSGNFMSGQDRVLEAIASQEAGTISAPDIILYENINDSGQIALNNLGTIADKPWMLSQYVTFMPETECTSALQASNALDANFAEVVNGVADKTAGTVVRVPFTTIYEGTQMTGYYLRYYTNSTDNARFVAASNWTGSKPTLNSCLKGAIEKLMTKYPTARVSIVGLPMTTYNSSESNPATYFYEDGTLDIYKAKHGTDRGTKTRANLQEGMIETWEELADLYNVPFINVANSCSINLLNLMTWYPSNNLHPKPEAYRRWAEVVYKELLP